ncbi:MAG: alpha/beta fold hydrolase [Burkholderiales bacterium]|nr:alpha/beta fold hydrolase [Phycisphaerae bacterium]
MAYVSLIIVLLVVAAAAGAVVLGMMALHLLKPPRMTDGRAMYILKRLDPSDLGLRFEPVDFQVRDEADGGTIRIAAWWIAADVAAARTVLILHGYSDAKVGGIAWAPVWHSLGWNVLAIDLRAHGESGGKYSTGGFFERDDVEHVIDQLRLARPQATRDLAIFGVSLGATIAAAIATRRDDLLAVILESPYSDFRIAIAAHGRRLAMPLELAYGLAMRLAQRMSGARYDQVRPVELIGQIRCPVLMIHSGRDTFVSAAEIDALAAVLAGRKQPGLSRHVIIAEAEHTLGLHVDPVAYREMIRSFISEIGDPPMPPAAESALS